MQVHVHYYAHLREITFTAAESFFLDPGATLGDLLSRVFVRHPQLLALAPLLLLARNDQFASREEPLAEGDVIDLMPPVSGG